MYHQDQLTQVLQTPPTQQHQHQAQQSIGNAR